MSRHELPAEGGLEVVVGWDPPMQTFFASVLDRTLRGEDPDYTKVWIGFASTAILDPRRVCDAVRPYAKEIPDWILPALHADALEAPGVLW
ncbi:hypothetical protein GCM10010435_44150 [Winogradskya consettensis]|uniref:Uncharacterized protein n=1 Tax=Winogradskya consettensis TaxID=113560 RepID=A0A919T2M5_9ACTN|nr:hypothetical protein [Actinoplanes consettensis]GIM82643.1 hypothetical protein Aco04nite_82540 [Actinoplanes consettensis]